MEFASVSHLIQAGFQGFVTIEALRASRCRDVPQVPGVYAIVRDSLLQPDFLSTSPGGHFKERDPSVPVPTLEANWIAGTIVMYIGKAGGAGSSATLRKRLHSYMRFGAGEPIGHWGGRLIWQLAGHKDLKVCWRPSSASEPREEERALLEAFEGIYQALPFANLAR